LRLPEDIAELVALARGAGAQQLGGELLGDPRAAEAAAPWKTVNELLAIRAAERPDNEYLTFADNETPGDEEAAAAPRLSRYSYRQIAERVARLRGVFQRLGLRPGDTISTVDRFNHADTVCLLLAAWCSGLRAAPLNMEEDDERLSFILKNAETKAVFVRESHAEQFGRINWNADVPTILTVGARRGALPFARLEALEAKAEPIPLQEDVPSPDAEALLVYTSGTTGYPKGVCLSHSLLNDVAAVVDFHNFTEGDVFATAMRLFHVNAIITSMLAALASGGRLLLLRRWEPRGFWSLVEDEGATTASVVPAMLADLLRAGGKPDPKIFHRFRTLICGAGTLKKALARQWLDTAPVRIAHGWGMSETTCWGCWLPADLSDEEYRALMLDREAPSIGMPHRFNRMGIMDAEGRLLPEKRKGQIVLAGPTVMEGYFQRDDANRDAFKHGVLETGDEGFWEPDSRGRPMFFITGRLKDIIERGGEKFSPYEMDDELANIEGVRTALVFGFPHERLGQEIGIVLEPEEGFGVTLERVQRHAHSMGYSWAKTPKEMRVVMSIPKTATGKETRKLFASLFAGCEKNHYKKPDWW
jgi:long-chain acyl-CoA synthetase